MAQIILDSNNNLIQGDFDNATLNNRTKLQTTTTNATTNVYVAPNGSATSAGVSVANNSSLTNASKIVMATNGTTDTQIISGVNGSGTYLPLSFYTNNALAMQIDTAATVAINTTGRPAGIGGGDNGKLWVKQTTTGNYGIAAIASATDSFISIANNGTTGVIGTSYGTTGSYMPLAFYTSDQERMRITSGGVVMINTTSAIGSSTERLGILQTNTSSDIITVRNSGATAGRYWSCPYVDTSNTYFIINNDSTGVKLTHGSTSWAAQSDARLKNITGTYTNALSDIAQIQPVKFTWKDDLTNKAQVGVIAQSVLPVVPEAVEALTIPKSEDGTEYLSVRYTELIPLMIASIQEQQAIINELKTRIEALESK
jgi:hypothetical protein